MIRNERCTNHGPLKIHLLSSFNIYIYISDFTLAVTVSGQTILIQGTILKPA